MLVFLVSLVREEVDKLNMVLKDKVRVNKVFLCYI